MFAKNFFVLVVPVKKTSGALLLKKTSVFPKNIFFGNESAENFIFGKGPARCSSFFLKKKRTD
jgi:hypothetical protein